MTLVIDPLLVEAIDAIDPWNVTSQPLQEGQLCAWRVRLIAEDARIFRATWDWRNEQHVAERCTIDAVRFWRLEEHLRDVVIDPPVLGFKPRDIFYLRIARWDIGL